MLRYIGNKPGSTGTPTQDGDCCEYLRTDPMEISVGGAPIGTTFDGNIIDALDKILYPYVNPKFNSFLINSTNNLEVGAPLEAGSKVFTWSTDSPDNIKPNSIEIEDVTAGIVLGSNLDNTGTKSVLIDDIVKTENSNHVWSIKGTSTKDQDFTRNFTLSWLWAVHYGESALTELLPSDVGTLRVKQLRSSSNGTYTMLGNNYKWICYPVSFGLKSSFKDVDTLFDVAMNPVQTISVTNEYGVTTDYYAHRTYNTMGSGIKIAVS